jgi:hypothetical protein
MEHLQTQGVAPTEPERDSSSGSDLSETLPAVTLLQSHEISQRMDSLEKSLSLLVEFIQKHSISDARDEQLEVDEVIQPIADQVPQDANPVFNPDEHPRPSTPVQALQSEHPGPTSDIP